jgi:DNA-binding transcriptional ArsR family regulator
MARRPPDSASPAPSAPAPPADDTRRILDALRRIVRDLRRAPTEATAATGVAATLGPARLFVLQLLAEHRTLSVSDLAALTHTDPSSVSVVARELVAAGLVTRSVDPGDQRRTSSRSARPAAPPSARRPKRSNTSSSPPSRRCPRHAVAPWRPCSSRSSTPPRATRAHPSSSRTPPSVSGPRDPNDEVPAPAGRASRRQIIGIPIIWGSRHDGAGRALPRPAITGVIDTHTRVTPRTASRVGRAVRQLRQRPL